MDVTRPPRPIRRRIWWFSFILFTALGSLWALTNPLLSVSDEGAHVFKAITVANGQLRGTDYVTRSDDPKETSGTLSMYTVDRSVAELLTRQDCWVLDRGQPMGCMPAITDDQEQVQMGMYAGNYPPLFYAVVGWPVHVFDLHTSIFVMRLIAVLISAALLASGLASISESFGRAGLIAGTALSLTPMAFHLFGSVNPNGVEIAAAFCLWAACIDLVTSARSPDNRLLARLVLSAGILAAIRPLSPVFVVAIVAAVLLLAGNRSRAHALWADRRVRVALAVGAAFVVADVIVIVALHSLDSFSGHAVPGLTRVEAAQGSLERLPERATEMIGLFGWGSAPVPRWLSDGWLYTAALVGLAALVVGTWRQRATLVAILLGTAGLPVVSETLKAPELGYVWQGRYSMGLAMGVVLVAGWILATSPKVPERATTVIAAVLAVGAGVGLVIGQSAWMRRTIVGINHPYFSWLTGTGWTPPLPAPLLGLATVVLAAAYSTWLILLADERSAIWRSRHRAPSDDGEAADVAPAPPGAVARS
jgi:hypothetical protein